MAKPLGKSDAIVKCYLNPKQGEFYALTRRNHLLSTSRTDPTYATDCTELIEEAARLGLGGHSLAKTNHDSIIDLINTSGITPDKLPKEVKELQLQAMFPLLKREITTQLDEKLEQSPLPITVECIPSN